MQPNLERLKKDYDYRRTMEKQHGNEANRLEKCVLCREQRMRSTCVGCEFAV